MKNRFLIFLVFVQGPKVSKSSTRFQTTMHFTNDFNKAEAMTNLTRTLYPDYC